MPSFGAAERRMLSYFVRGTELLYKQHPVEVLYADKPTCASGEPKTDIFVLVKGKRGPEEIKISYKKENADFLENKTNSERAEALFGSSWRYIIENATKDIEEQFYNRMLIYKEKFRRTEKGSITLGWKFELLNKPGGDLSGRMNLSRDQVYDVYAGTNLSAEKRNAFVNGKMCPDSGVADYILMTDEAHSAQDIIDQMVSIDDYIDKHPNIYFACKALNYRTFYAKYDGNRPLAVQVDWSVRNGKLVSELHFDKPLEMNGNEMANRLCRCLEYLNIQTTDDINSANADMRVVFK